MGLLTNLSKMKLGLQGKTPVGYNATGKQSKLHFEYSINGNPGVRTSPSPSQLDLDGKIPPTNYRDNAPEGATF